MLQNRPIEIDIAIEIGIGCYGFDQNFDLDFETIVSSGLA